LWLQPGGHFEEDDENLEVAARREVHEETGIGDLENLDAFPGLFDIDIHSIPANPRRREPAHQHFDLRLAFMASSDQITVSPEVIDARWVPLDDVTTLGSDDSVLRCTRRLNPNNESFSGSP
jgi:8-oxo-dGTP pyrophosphatase MutT (NUDIX family)